MPRNPKASAVSTPAHEAIMHVMQAPIAEAAIFVAMLTSIVQARAASVPATQTPVLPPVGVAAPAVRRGRRPQVAPMGGPSGAPSTEPVQNAVPARPALPLAATPATPVVTGPVGVPSVGQTPPTAPTLAPALAAVVKASNAIGSQPVTALAKPPRKPRSDKGQARTGRPPVTGPTAVTAAPIDLSDLPQGSEE